MKSGDAEDMRCEFFRKLGAGLAEAYMAPRCTMFNTMFNLAERHDSAFNLLKALQCLFAVRMILYCTRSAARHVIRGSTWALLLRLQLRLPCCLPAQYRQTTSAAYT